jgi:hypothetical protein
MSTHEEIMEVYNAEIAEKTKYVENKFGLLAFFEGGRSMRQFKMYDVDPSATKYQGEK